MRPTSSLHTAMSNGPQCKSCQSCLWGPNWPHSHGSLASVDLKWDKLKKSSDGSVLKPLGPQLIYLVYSDV